MTYKVKLIFGFIRAKALRNFQDEKKGNRKFALCRLLSPNPQGFNLEFEMLLTILSSLTISFLSRFTSAQDCHACLRRKVM